MISEDKNNFIILKPKYELKRIKKDYYNIYRIILKLKKISNIKVIDYKKSAEDIIALSDLIISMPFTSMTAQGIYNYVPSIYLDLHEQFPHNLYKKNNIYFNNGSKASRAIKKIIYLIYLIELLH